MAKKKNNRPTFQNFKKNALKNKEFREEYFKLEPEFDFAHKLIFARKKSKITQSTLAEKLKTKQPAIARFEKSGFKNSSISKLQEYANAIGYEIHIQLIPKSKNISQNTKRPI